MPEGGFPILGIIIAIIAVAVGSAIGLAMIGTVGTTFTNLNLGAAANNAFGYTGLKFFGSFYIHIWMLIEILCRNL